MRCWFAPSEISENWLSQEKGQGHGVVGNWKEKSQCPSPATPPTQFLQQIQLAMAPGPLLRVPRWRLGS